MKLFIGLDVSLEKTAVCVVNEHGKIVKETQVFDIGAHQTQFIEIYNMEGGKGIIAAIINLEPQYWYFTAKGNVDELKAHAGDIRAFLESIEFEGHSH